MFDWFHRNPELSFKETATAARMAKELRAIPGIEVTEKVGGTGVVGVMRNGAGPTVLLRADMDGLPVEEKSGLPNASKARQVDIDGVEKPVMHACGHDTHITGLVATARQLAALKDRWKGTVVLDRPARRGTRRRGQGDARGRALHALSQARLCARLARRFRACLGQGQRVGNDPICLGRQRRHHRPRRRRARRLARTPARDPIYIGAQIVTALQGLVGREIDPIKPALITVGSFHSGSKHNIISDRAELLLTVRANDEETRQYLLEGDPAARARHRAAPTACPKTSCRWSPIPKGRRSPPTTPALARRLNATLASALGSANVVPFVQQGMGGEDFAYFVEPEIWREGLLFRRRRNAAGGVRRGQGRRSAGAVAPQPVVQDRARAGDLVTEAMMTAALDLLGPARSKPLARRSTTS